ncbi:glycosyltransferase [Camelimonas abortus]|uniref:Glycosyltransferase n=1 Tax=Camelimonas abortus TaxID=1017184 RepID=A0ABV7LDV1_9HYPH
MSSETPRAPSTDEASGVTGADAGERVAAGVPASGAGEESVATEMAVELQGLLARQEELVRRLQRDNALLAASHARLVDELVATYARPHRPFLRFAKRQVRRLQLLLQDTMDENRVLQLRRSFIHNQPEQFRRDALAAIGRPVDDLALRAWENLGRVPLKARLLVQGMRWAAAATGLFRPDLAARLRNGADRRDPYIRAFMDATLAARASRTDVPLITDPARAGRIFVSDFRLPRPDVSAGERATAGLVRDLARLGFEVVFCPLDMAENPASRNMLEAAGARVVTARDGYPDVRAFLLAHGGDFGAFYLIRIETAEAILPYVRMHAPDARVIFHAPDLAFLRERRGAELSGSPEQLGHAEATARRELAMMQAADHVALVSPAEAPYVSAHVGADRISVFPALYGDVAQDPPPFGARADIFFLGGYAHAPNVDAVRWFVDEVWPRVRAALPEATFHILGAEAPESVRALGERPGVKFVGYVEDLAPALAGFRVAVAPLLYGAGIKGKVAMAMGAGVATVCTAIAAEGMDIRPGEDALVADYPGAFAEAVIQAYRDPELWRRLSASGRALVARKFGAEANLRALARLLDEAHVLPPRLYAGWIAAQAPDPAGFRTFDGDVVDVSIIIPVHNQWRLTRNCLVSAQQALRDFAGSYEVILADDASSDETVQAQTLFPGLRVTRNDSSVGFLRNCRKAAATARGRRLLFLNNDTVALPGWLEPLMAAMEDGRVAIAGSLLLYPDGTIQDCGAVLHSDGSATPVGRGAHPAGPFWQGVRETDYVTGAAMLVRRSFWDEVGGFDERYAPAYCEDSDLAMAARARGHMVVCAPASRVIHFEHGSYAADQASAPRRMSRVNGVKLLEKWREEFVRDHLPAGVEPLVAAAHAERRPPAPAVARRRSGRLNVLYFSPFPSHPDSHGNQATIQSFARRFQAMGHKVHFVLLESGMYSATDLEQMKAAWDSLDLLPNSCPFNAHDENVPFDGWYQEGTGERIQLLCRKYDIDVVFCSYVFQSRLLEYVPAHILKVIDTHDKMGDRYEMLRRNNQKLEFFSCTPEEEGAYLRRADIVVARRQEEADYFNAVTGRNSAIVIPHVEDARYVERPFTKLDVVGLVASANRINLAITLDFLKAVERRAGAGGPPFSVRIAGQVKNMVRDLPAADQALFARPWVTMCGFVEDIGDFYRSVDLVASPVTMGTGINVKTVQAMAYGMPLVTTAWGAKGIETGHPLHGHKDLDALAQTLFALRDDPARLAELAETSRRRYDSFLAAAQAAMAAMFARVRTE